MDKDEDEEDDDDDVDDDDGRTTTPTPMPKSTKKRKAPPISQGSRANKKANTSKPKPVKKGKISTPAII